MKALLYLGLVIFLVPLQTILLPHVTVWGIKPDMGLLASAFIGLLAGELEGLLMGVAIGWVLSVFSAGELWLAVLTKGGVGFLAGLLGRQVVHVTPAFVGVGLLLISLLTGVAAVLTFKNIEGPMIWQILQLIVLPQACFDAAVGAGLYTFFAYWYNVDRFRIEERGLRGFLRGA